jgi:pyruvate formate lyase activating enzyme
MKIGGYVKSSLIDYPGKIASVIFTQGCVFRCKFCHNAELVIPELFKETLLKADIINHLKERQGKLDGVVISGGEPTIQKDLLEVMKIIKSLGYLVKLDTMGYFPDVVEKAINEKVVDYIAMDIKAPFAKYSEVTGYPIDISRIKRSIKLIKNCSIDYEFRTTAPTLLLSRDDLITIAKEIKGAKHYYLQQFKAFKTLDLKLLNTPTYSIEELHKISEYISQNYTSCSVRG